MSHKLEKAKPKAATAQARNPSSMKKGGGSAAINTCSTSLQAVKGRPKEDGRTVSITEEVRLSSPSEDSTVCLSTSYQHEGDGFVLQRSAAVSKLEREIAELKNENCTLRKELSEVRLLHEQLVHELPQENFTEKRVNLLKSQIIQLERQVVLMSDALGTRRELMTDLYNMLDWLEDRAKSGSNFSEDMLQKTSSLKSRLSKYSQTSSLESLAQPLGFLEHFVQPKSRAKAPFNTRMGGATNDCAVTLVDVCRRGLEYTNLKHVSRLESKLADLYGLLTQLLSSVQNTHLSSVFTSGSLLDPVREHCHDHMTKSCKLIGECCHDLLCLSLLTPAVPWPPLKGDEVSFSVSSGDILKEMPVNIRNRREVKDAITAAVQAFSYHSDMQETKLNALENELKFHESVYGLQIEYVETLFKAVRVGYQDFEAAIQHTICTPIEDILKGYDTLAQNANDTALRDFLESIKTRYPQLKNAITNIKRPGKSEDKEGVNTLSTFGDQFFQQLHDLEKACCKHRRTQIK